MIAEGIETQMQANILQSIECQQGQGYFYHHPLDQTVATELLLQTMSSNTVTQGT